MANVILIFFRFYFRTLARIAPRTAGRHAYRLFSTPRRRASVPSAVEDVMARAERFNVESPQMGAVGTSSKYNVAAYRWAANEAAGPTPPRVLLIHGWESRAARMAVWVDPLLAAGFEVVGFDAPAHGESSGRRANPMALADAIWAVVDHAGPLSACVGHSLGGFASLLAVSGGQMTERQEMAVERLVILAGANSGVDAMSMFCDVLGLDQGDAGVAPTPEGDAGVAPTAEGDGGVAPTAEGDGGVAPTSEGFPRRGTNGNFLPLLLAGAAEAAGGRQVTDFDAHRLFADHPVPTLWLHDPDDDEVPFAAAEKVAGACPHVTLEPVPGFGHHRIVRDPAMISRGLEFLADLARESAA